MRRRLPAPLAAALLPVLVLVAAGCGSSEKSSSPNPPPASAKPQDFPSGTGRTYDNFRSRYPEQLSIGIGASVMRQGSNRIPFLILDKGARPISNAPVALYTVRNDGTGVRGPFVAREQPFDIKPAYLSRTTQSDPDQQKKFFVADVPFKGKQPQAVFALVRQDGRLVAASPSPLGAKLEYPKPPPDVGEKAISVHTDTVEDVSDVSKLTTRVPPATDMLQDDLADVLGKKPIVFIVATPALCQSRVCGPDVDVAEQVKAEVGGDVAFIQQEVYKDNQVNKGLRPQLIKWRLASEPWIFVIDRTGRIAARIEGAVSVPELRAAVEKVL
jgi:hypothetical protein